MAEPRSAPAAVEASVTGAESEGRSYVLMPWVEDVARKAMLGERVDIEDEDFCAVAEMMATLYAEQVQP